MRRFLLRRVSGKGASEITADKDSTGFRKKEMGRAEEKTIHKHDDRK